MMKSMASPDCCRLCKYHELAPQEMPCRVSEWDKEKQQCTEYKELDIKS